MKNTEIMKKMSFACALNESRKTEDLAAAWLMHSCGRHTMVSKRREERKTHGCEDVRMKESVLLSRGTIALLT